MIFNVSGGGGASLNFKIVGGTARPSNPSENTIWINTGEEITSWIFSATEPVTPSEGMVWISTGKSSKAAFNILKKNILQVYPISAKQFLSDTWVMMPAVSFQNEMWVDWVIPLTLIPNAEDYPSSKWTASRSGVSINVTENNAVVSYDSDGKSYVFMISLDVDVTDFTTMTLKGNAAVTKGSTSSPNIKVGLFNGETMITGYSTQLANGASADIDNTYDISELTGMTSFAFYFQTGSSSTYIVSVEMDNVTFS